MVTVTDHGHQAQRGLGHGFQSPDETTTFVVARSPGLFGEGVVNPKYSIVDVTPTALSLFGYGSNADGLDGVPLTELGGADVTPVDAVGGLIYAGTNVLAQTAARLTGVTGASIFPLRPPA